MPTSERHVEIPTRSSILPHDEDTVSVNSADHERTSANIKGATPSSHGPQTTIANTPSPVAAPSSPWTHVLVLSGRMYAVNLVPSDLATELHEGDLVACESGRGGSAGIVVKNVSALVAGPGAMRDRAAELAISMSSAGPSREPSSSPLTAEKELERPNVSLNASHSATSSPLGSALDHNASSQLSSPPASPLYAQRLDTGLQMDHCIMRLPQVRRRGVNRDKKRLYFSQRRGAEALQCVLQKLEERTLASHLLVDEVEYQVDFVSATVHLAGHPNEHGFSHEQYHRLGQILLGPLRTQVVEFRHSRAFPEQLHRTRYFFSDDVNAQLRNLVEDYEKRNAIDGRGSHVPRSSDQSNNSDPTTPASSVHARVGGAYGNVMMPPPRATIVSTSAVSGVPPHVIAPAQQQPQPVQMMQVHPAGQATLFHSSATVPAFYTPLASASGSAGLPMFLPQSSMVSSAPAAAAQAAPHGFTLVEMPQWPQMGPTLIPLQRAPSTDLNVHMIASPQQQQHPQQQQQYPGGGNVSLNYPSFPSQSQTTTSSSGSSMLVYYSLPHMQGGGAGGSGTDLFRPRDAAGGMPHGPAQLPPQSQTFAQPYYVTYAQPANRGGAGGNSAPQEHGPLPQRR